MRALLPTNPTIPDQALQLYEIPPHQAAQNTPDLNYHNKCPSLNLGREEVRSFSCVTLDPGSAQSLDGGSAANLDPGQAPSKQSLGRACHATAV